MLTIINENKSSSHISAKVTYLKGIDNLMIKSRKN